MKGELAGGCVCGAVRYTLREGQRMNPYACHCTDCQSRTGSAFSEHMGVARADLSIEGDLDHGRYTQPSGAISTIYGCARCKTRIYAENDLLIGFASIRCGTLDRSLDVEPAAHLWVSSKQRWLQLPEDVPQLDQQPRSPEEWLAVVGMS